MSDQQGVGGPSRIDSLPFDPESATLIATAPRGGHNQGRGDGMYSPTPQYPGYQQQQGEQLNLAQNGDYAQYESTPVPNMFPHLTAQYQTPGYQYEGASPGFSGDTSMYQGHDIRYMDGSGVSQQDGSWSADFVTQENGPSAWSMQGGDTGMNDDTGMELQQQLVNELVRMYVFSFQFPA
jgi:hypothetical protein